MLTPEERRKRNRESDRCWRAANPEKIRENNAKRVRFKGKLIRVGFNPRSGTCSVCGRKVGQGIRRTQMHHERYDERNPLAHTRELCVSCHRKRHSKKAA